MENYDSVFLGIKSEEIGIFEDDLCISTSKLNISTMSVCSCLDMVVDLNTLCEILDVSRGKGNFYNCVSLKLIIMEKKVHVKIFPNGKLQFAGIKPPFSIIHKYPEFMRDYLSVLDGVTMNSDEIRDTRIVMINSNFDLGSCINQPTFAKMINDQITDTDKEFVESDSKLCRELSQIEDPSPMDIYRICTSQGYEVSEPRMNNIANGGVWKSATIKSRYPGVNAKFMSQRARDALNTGIKPKKGKFPGELSVLVFRSGNIVITGGTDLNDYSEAYACLSNLFRSNFEELCYWDEESRPKNKNRR